MLIMLPSYKVPGRIPREKVCRTLTTLDKCQSTSVGMEGPSECV